MHEILEGMMCTVLEERNRTRKLFISLKNLLMIVSCATQQVSLKRCNIVHVSVRLRGASIWMCLCVWTTIVH
jgi:uncharacterized lipoprotein YajG